MAAFHGKIGWGGLRKGENKNYRSITFLPNHYVPTQPVRENSKKITKKFKKHNYGIISSQNRLEKTEKERK